MTLLLAKQKNETKWNVLAETDVITKLLEVSLEDSRVLYDEFAVIDKQYFDSNTQTIVENCPYTTPENFEHAFTEKLLGISY